MWWWCGGCGATKTELPYNPGAFVQQIDPSLIQRAQTLPVADSGLSVGQDGRGVHVHGKGVVGVVHDAVVVVGEIEGLTAILCELVLRLYEQCKAVE